MPTTYKVHGDYLITTTKREIQERSVVITRTADGDLIGEAHAGPGHTLKLKDIPCREHMQSWAVSVWLGGPTVWTWHDDGTTETWTSETVVCENGGVRFTPEELEVVRKQWKRRKK